MKKSTIVKTLQVIVLLVALWGTVSRLILSWRGYSVNGMAIFYFTVQSNIFVCVFYLSQTIKDIVARVREGKAVSMRIFHPGVHGGVLLYIMVTGLIYNVLLASTAEPKSSYDFLILTINHSFTPILVLVHWIASRFTLDAKEYKARFILYWLIYPILYLIFAIAEGLVSGDFLYFFLDFVNQPLGSFFLYFSMVFGIVILLGFIILWANNKLIGLATSKAGAQKD